MTPIKILFVCHGNICRSPMAEFILKGMAPEDGFYIESAAVSREEIGNDIYPPAKAIMREKGVTFERRAARQMTSEDYNRFDYIIGMDESNISRMNRICGGDPDGKISAILDFAGESRGVSDPWYTGDFEQTYDDIVRGCEALLEHIRNRKV